MSAQTGRVSAQGDRRHHGRERRRVAASPAVTRGRRRTGRRCTTGLRHSESPEVMRGPCPSCGAWCSSPRPSWASCSRASCSSWRCSGRMRGARVDRVRLTSSRASRSSRACSAPTTSGP
ncbi:hypothetical protein QJS66_10525 [Kocuria rhizophila]|nr:hypothetical protein QJS66_10525 [Kocuria rhizophila]